jgi:hypothetical protein
MSATHRIYNLLNQAGGLRQNGGAFPAFGQKNSLPGSHHAIGRLFLFLLFRAVRVLPVVPHVLHVVIFSRCNREKLLYICIVYTFLMYFTIKHNLAFFPQ